MKFIVDEMPKSCDECVLKTLCGNDCKLISKQQIYLQQWGIDSVIG